MVFSLTLWRKQVNFGIKMDDTLTMIRKLKEMRRLYHDPLKMTSLASAMGLNLETLRITLHREENGGTLYTNQALAHWIRENEEYFPTEWED